MQYKKLIAGLTVAASVTFGSTAQAEDNGHLYLGLKTGSFLVDLDGTDDPTPFGIQLGYDLGKNFSLEFEYLSGSADFTTMGVNGDIDVDTMALFGTFRSADKLYLLGKIGLLKEDVTASASSGFSSASFSADDTGMSLGFGGGFRLSESFAVEAEYTLIEEDVDYIGLTARIIFPSK